MYINPFVAGVIATSMVELIIVIAIAIFKRAEKQTGTTWAFTARQFAFGGATFVNPVIYIVCRYRDWETDRKSTRLNSSHEIPSRMPSSA